ncbi:MAG: hypothetical protein IT178_08810 [Acidobacteria bacterium]|nr:hypothetical protein [Acidobacteriota bacterium]
MSGDARDRVRARVLTEQERTLSAEETAAYLSAPVTDEERENVRALVRWFTRRYPTGAERLAYVRRAYRRWHER